MEKLAGVCKRICVFLLTLASQRRGRPVTDDSKRLLPDATRGVRRLKRRQDSCYNGYFQALRRSGQHAVFFFASCAGRSQNALLHIKIYLSFHHCFVLLYDCFGHGLPVPFRMAQCCFPSGNSVSHVFFCFVNFNLTCLFREE